MKESKPVHSATKGKIAEFQVIGELLKRGVQVYVPIVDVEGIDAIVRQADGSLVEIQVKSSHTNTYPRFFIVPAFEPRDNFFIVGVVLGLDEPETWIIPSARYVELCAKPSKSNTFELDLDQRPRGTSIKRSALLAEYFEAWHLLTGAYDEEDEQELEAGYRASMEVFAEDWSSKEDAVYDTL